jgi:nucleoside 2-deoxyribosyltransferase
MKVYLAGKMEAITLEEAQKWRNKVKAILEPHNIKTLDPCRRIHNFEDRYLKRIFELDLLDIRNADVIIADLENIGETPSHGTAMELFYANYMLEKPVIGFRSFKGKKHPFIEQVVTEFVSTPERACEVLLEEYL